MRATISVLFLLLLPSGAQQRPAAPLATQMQARPVPDEAAHQNARLAASLSPSAKAKVQSSAAALAAAAKQQPTMTAAQMQAKARASVTQAFPNLRGTDIDAVVFMVMMQCAQDQQTELQQAMSQMQQNTAAKKAARGEKQAGAASQMSDASDLESLKLQSLMDQRSKLLEAISNVMKSASDTQSSIISNLK